MMKIITNISVALSVVGLAAVGGVVAIAQGDSARNGADAPSGAVSQANAAAHRSGIPEPLQAIAGSRGGNMSVQFTVSTEVGSVSVGRLTPNRALGAKVKQPVSRAEICQSVTLAGGGGSVGCRASESVALTEPLATITALGNERYGLTVTLPPGSTDVRVVSSDGRQSDERVLVRDSFGIVGVQSDFGTLRWRRADGSSVESNLSRLSSSTASG